MHITLFSSFDAVRTPYQRFCQEGWLTAYEHPAWLESWAQNHPDQVPIFALAEIGTDLDIAMLLPLTKSKSWLGTQCAFLGSDVSNGSAPLLRGDPELLQQHFGRKAVLNAVCAAIRHQHPDIDLFCFQNQRARIGHYQNPLLSLNHHAAINPVFESTLDTDFHSWLSARRSKRSIHKLKRKQKRLEEQGTLQFKTYIAAEQRKTALQTFLTQKAERFQQQGIKNTFSAPAMKAFLQDALRTTQDKDSSTPLFRLDAMEFDGAPIAIMGGLQYRAHYSCFIISNDLSDCLTRYSPGELLLHHVLRSLAREGFRSFDLGQGDEAYKHRWSDPKDLHNITAPATFRGAVLNTIAIQTTRAKSYLRGTPRLWSSYKKLRAFTSGVRARQPVR